LTTCATARSFAVSIATIEQEMLPEMPVTRGNTNLLHVIWQRKSLVILGIVIGLILGSLFYVQRTPIYASYAGVLVVPKSAATSVGATEAAFLMRDYMGTKSMILRSGVIHERAAMAPEIKSKIDSGLLKSYPTAQKPEDIVPEMATALTVTRENKESVGPGGNDVLILTFKGTDASESEMFLRCIIKAYQEFLDEKYANASAQVLQNINEAKGELETRIKLAEDAMDEFQKKQNTLAVMSQYNGGMPTLYKEYQALGEKIAKLKDAMSEKQTDLKSFQKIYDRDGPKEAMQALLAAKKDVLGGQSELERKLQ